MSASVAAPSKPSPMEVIEENVPAALKVLKRWVGWSWLWNPTKHGVGGWDKPPLNVRTGRNASSTNDSTWATFEEAYAAADEGRYDGIGITLGAVGDGRTLAGVDLDGVRDAATGKLASWAVWVSGRLETYCEVSPSGQGVKFLAFGTLPRGTRNDSEGRGVEMYDSGRYFTVTGHHLPSTTREVNECTASLSHLHAELLGSTLLFRSGEQEHRDDREWALELLAAMKPSRAEGYGEWLAVGMALHSIADDMLADWDAWSRRSSKYEPGACKKKWSSFKKGGLTLGSLFHWAKEDGWTPRILVQPSGTGRSNATVPINGKVVSEAANQATTAEDAPRDPLGWLYRYGVPVSKVVKIGAKQGVFDLLLNDGQTIQLGPAADVLMPRKVQSAIADATRIVIPELSRKDWRIIAAELFRVAELEDVESDPQSELFRWIDEFVYTNCGEPIHQKSDLIERLKMHGVAVALENRVYLRSTKFLIAISGFSPIKISLADLHQRLFREGFTNEHLQAKDRGKNVQVKAWLSPSGYMKRTQLQDM